MKTDYNIDLSLLDPVEKIIFCLRNLYCSYGYKKYRMSKFEEYDLYARNKDYLVSDGIITFTDTTGRLMALKPDVTLSIIKNTRDLPDSVQRLCYNENVYRVSKSTGSFRELMQAGIECLGDIDERCKAEVAVLAAKSMELFGEEYVVEISDLDILSFFLDRITDNVSIKNELLKCISSKNIHGIQDISVLYGLSSEASEDLILLAGIYGCAQDVFGRLDALCKGKICQKALDEMKKTFDLIEKSGYGSKIIVDFSSVSNLKYYNGMTFKGFIKGIPDSVISGGQYDKLMKRMGRKSLAVGFAVYLDMLDGHGI